MTTSSVYAKESQAIERTCYEALMRAVRESGRSAEDDKFANALSKFRDIMNKLSEHCFVEENNSIGEIWELLEKRVEEATGARAPSHAQIADTKKH